MASYLEKKYEQYSGIDKCFVRSQASFETQLSEPQIMELQRKIFKRAILNMTKFQFFILVEEALLIEV